MQQSAAGPERYPNGGNVTFGVYVAGATTADQVARVTAAIESLQREGFRVTCTWPAVVAATPGGANPRDASDVARIGWSMTDLAEINAAHAVWFLVPSPPTATRGAWFESGFAFARDKYVLFSGDTKQSVFCALGREFATDDEALRCLLEIRARELAIEVGQ